MVRMWSVMNSGPVAQFRPIDSRSAWAMEAQNASAVWPASIVPIGSMVPDTIVGMRRPSSRRSRSMASSAALTLRVSWQVSTAACRRRPRPAPSTAFPAPCRLVGLPSNSIRRGTTECAAAPRSHTTAIPTWHVFIRQCLPQVRQNHRVPRARRPNNSSPASRTQWLGCFCARAARLAASHPGQSMPDRAGRRRGEVGRRAAR